MATIPRRTVLALLGSAAVPTLAATGPGMETIVRDLPWCRMVMTRRNGLLHSFDDEPAVRVTTARAPHMHAWYRNGKLHRDAKQANALYDAAGKLQSRA